MRRSLFLALLLLASAVHAEAPTQKVDIDDVVEAGTVEAVNGVTSSGQPNEAALKVFSDSGYAAVIDLRGEQEDRGLENEAALVESFGMDYVSLPISGRDSISFDNAAKLGKLIDSYDGPVLIHCGSGNRVGALLALRASLDGADDEAAIEAGREGGLTRAEGLVRERLSEAD